MVFEAIQFMYRLIARFNHMVHIFFRSIDYYFKNIFKQYQLLEWIVFEKKKERKERRKKKKISIKKKREKKTKRKKMKKWTKKNKKKIK